MKIQFVNKNNNEWFDIQPGITITDNYNETLDSANLVITHLERKLDIEPFDRVIIDMLDGNYKYLCVDTYNRFQLSFSDEIYYEYNISLFSETKLLEGDILPSLKITQLKGPSRRKIIYYLNEYLNEYGRKVRKKINNSISYQPLWHFSQKVIDRFSKIECPEMQWNQPTLRQILNDLMMIDDCIVVLRNNEIDYIDISVQGDEISTIGISQVQESRSSQDYVSELRVELKNVMQSNIDGVNNVITTTENIGFRVEDSYKLDTKQFRIETRNPILEIEKVEISGIIEGNDNQTTAYPDKYYINLDITSYIFDYKEWLTKPVFFSEGLSDFGIPPIDSVGQYQQNSLYYHRGGTIIGNFDSIEQGLFNLTPKNGFEMVVLGEIRRLYPSRTIAEVWTNTDIFKNLMFRVKYKTTATSLMQVSRSDNVINYRVVVDNQTNSYVDAYAQGLLEYMKVNRLGNTMKVIDARYNYEDNIPELSQTFNDAVIFQRKSVYFDDYIEANFYATEGYVLRDYFTGIQAKIRSWKIVNGNEALERHDLIKYYLEFSYNNINEVDLGEIETANIAEYFLNQFNDNSVKLIQYGCVDFIQSIILEPTVQVYKQPEGDNYYLIDTVSRLSGNSLLFTIGLNDNYYAGKVLNISIDAAELGGIAQEPCRYTDSNGENIGGHIVLTNELKKYDLPTEPLYSYDVSGATRDVEQDKETIQSFQPLRPIISTAELISDLKINIPFTFKKDNSEITRITTQFEFCSDTADIVFGSQFLKNLQAIRTVELDIDGYKIYGSNKAPSFRNKDYLPSDKYQLNLTDKEVLDNRLTIVYTSNNYQYLYLTDKNDNVILAFKKKGDTVTSLYLNLLRDRNKNIYDDNGYIVGNIYI